MRLARTPHEGNLRGVRAIDVFEAVGVVPQPPFLLLCYCVLMENLLESLRAKYEDILACADDWAERNLAEEMLEDIREIGRRYTWRG